jgi:hypothetical protein
MFDLGGYCMGGMECIISVLVICLIVWGCYNCVK